MPLMEMLSLEIDALANAAPAGNVLAGNTFNGTTIGRCFFGHWAPKELTHIAPTNQQLGFNFNSK